MNFKLQKESGSVSLEMLPLMHPTAVLMIAWSNLWCFNHGITPEWTSWIRTKEQNEKLGGTKVHVDGRGADLSDKEKHGWTPILREKFLKEFYEEFKDVGALVEKQGEFVSRPIVWHDSGYGSHFHMQCRW